MAFTLNPFETGIQIPIIKCAQITTLTTLMYCRKSNSVCGFKKVYITGIYVLVDDIST